MQKECKKAALWVVQMVASMAYLKVDKMVDLMVVLLAHMWVVM